MICFILSGIGGDEMLFENFEDIMSYEYVYPVDVWLVREFKKAKHYEPGELINDEFKEFILTFTEGVIKRGRRKYGETEDEWRLLWFHFISQRNLYRDTHTFEYSHFLIILDQALILEHEGQPIPNLLR